jgi:flagellar FliL protein
MAEQGDKATKRQLNMILLLCLLSLLGTVAVGAGLFMLWAAKMEPKETKIIEQKPEPGKIYDLGPFIVNLADEDASRYVRAEVSLEYSKTNLELDREVRERVPQFKDLVNTLLNDRKAGELTNSEGKERFRRELQLKVNHQLKFGSVTNVFLTSFAIQ